MEEKEVVKNKRKGIPQSDPEIRFRTIRRIAFVIAGIVFIFHILMVSTSTHLFGLSSLIRPILIAISLLWFPIGIAGIISSAMSLWMDVQTVRRAVTIHELNLPSQEWLSYLRDELTPHYRSFRQSRFIIWIVSLIAISSTFWAACLNYGAFYINPVSMTVFYTGLYTMLSLLFLYEPLWRFKTLSTLVAIFIGQSKTPTLNTVVVIISWWLFLAVVGIMISLMPLPFLNNHHPDFDSSNLIGLFEAESYYRGVTYIGFMTDQPPVNSSIVVNIVFFFRALFVGILPFMMVTIIVWLSHRIPHFFLNLSLKYQSESKFE